MIQLELYYSVGTDKAARNNQWICHPALCEWQSGKIRITNEKEAFLSVIDKDPNNSKLFLRIILKIICTVISVLFKLNEIPH